MANSELEYIRMQLEWRPQISMNPYKKEESAGGFVECKQYLVNREGLQIFIQTLQRELLNARHLNVKCIIS